jgi:hypothetical protein
MKAYVLQNNEGKFRCNNLIWDEEYHRDIRNAVMCKNEWEAKHWADSMSTFNGETYQVVTIEITIV